MVFHYKSNAMRIWVTTSVVMLCLHVRECNGFTAIGNERRYSFLTASPQWKNRRNHSLRRRRVLTSLSKEVGESDVDEKLGGKKEFYEYSARYTHDNDIELVEDESGVHARRRGKKASAKDKSQVSSTASTKKAKKSDKTDAVASSTTAHPVEPKSKASSSTTSSTITINSHRNKKKVLEEVTPSKIEAGNGFNIVLTHCTADFDSLASAVGLAKLWSAPSSSITVENDEVFADKSSSLPTFVVLPRGAHPGVQKFLSLHKHLFPIRSLRSLPSDLTLLNRLGLVDAQRRDRIGPAEHLIGYAKRVTVVDHHIDGESDIPEASDYVVDPVGSVSTLVVEQLKKANVEITEAEATLLALGIHADTGSLCFDSTTPRDAYALSYVMEQGASQSAIAEHVQTSLSAEQQGVLTQALLNTNSTVVHGVTVSSVLLSTEGFINGLAAVTQDALDLTGSDVLILSCVYDAKSKSKNNKKSLGSSTLSAKGAKQSPHLIMHAEAWKGGEEAMKRRRLRAAFDKKDTDKNGYLDRSEIISAMTTGGIMASNEAVNAVMSAMDKNQDGRIDFDEFLLFASQVEIEQKEREKVTGQRASTMIIIGRVKPGVNLKHVNLNRLFQKYGGGGHAKAASATVRLGDESEAGLLLQGIVDELIQTSLLEQQTVGDFMTAPVLSAKPDMTEKQVEDLFTRYDVRALPVVDDGNNVIGLVTYKEVAAAKQRLWNKEQKRLRFEQKQKQEQLKDKKGNNTEDTHKKRNNTEAIQEQKQRHEKRKLGSALKGWMKQHVQVVEASVTMAEAEAMLLANDVGCIPVVADGSKQLVGMVTRTDLLRQHRYYPSLHYHNKGFSDSIAARKPLIELRRRLKKYDIEDE